VRLSQRFPNFTGTEFYSEQSFPLAGCIVTDLGDAQPARLVLEVLDVAGQVVRRKALMFQGKKGWRGANKTLFKQAEDMVAYTPSAIVVDYRKAGFTAVAALDMVEAGGNGRNIPQERPKRLAEILGDEFVRCRRGTIGSLLEPGNASTGIRNRYARYTTTHDRTPHDNNSPTSPVNSRSRL
jgi:hypothetical protein